MAWPPFDSPCLTPPPGDAVPLGPCAHCQVRHLAICSALTHEEMHALDAVAGVQLLGPGAVLARQGEPRKHVFTVTRGALRLVRLSADGRRQVAGFALPGDFVGLSGAPVHQHDVEALAETELCRFGTDAMARLGVQFPQLQAKLLERACTELDSAREQMMALARMNPTERMADFLLKLAAQQARAGNAGRSISLPMPRADIADHLGLTVETVSRCLTGLRSRGLIALPETYRVEILDFAGLEALNAA
ncbi:Crp/Fnr family transcriptional regulator [Pseudoxanthomonas jiangsuensis]|uniref:Crp/Fnr family transcriptional regulator n=1 Tax=Pseudoxanthomonas jiangsuensis TaxID=619688 RepID=UPI001391810C|nr:Crp/Fnr family transcriptional regulator [Pseudoxanthomonas jiangsuensis]KAF1698014.1 Crp/Fnr family transcriptional regulator [Pseudoxanthomonas jiangsuensis]